ncbi:hypothetical protein BSK67_19700 [Paenibacillus odorifer]|nr:hypothetical protein BSK67_19700 [Paenibacillus odorifer]
MELKRKVMDFTVPYDHIPRVAFSDIGLGGWMVGGWAVSGGCRQWAVGDLLGEFFIRFAVGFKLIREKLPENSRYSL